MPQLLPLFPCYDLAADADRGVTKLQRNVLAELDRQNEAQIMYAPSIRGASRAELTALSMYLYATRAPLSVRVPESCPQDIMHWVYGATKGKKGWGQTDADRFTIVVHLPADAFGVGRGGDGDGDGDDDAWWLKGEYMAVLQDVKTGHLYGPGPAASAAAATRLILLRLPRRRRRRRRPLLRRTTTTTGSRRSLVRLPSMRRRKRETEKIA